MVANAGDHANAACALAVREAGFTGPRFALADEPLYRAPMLQMGATEVFTPSHALGAALASRASVRISPPAEGMHLLGNALAMAEFRVRPESQLAGQRLGDLQLRDKHGVSVIGQWRGGLFTAADGPDLRVEAGAILGSGAAGAPAAFASPAQVIAAASGGQSPQTQSQPAQSMRNQVRLTPLLAWITGCTLTRDTHVSICRWSGR